MLDSNGSVFWSAPSLIVNGAGPSHSNYSPNIVSSTSITIEWGSNWNIGIDNVSFAQQAVPEPATMAALGLGLAALARRRRR
ncbi:PEP-CTERM sorting domain-containing protein [bacterium]|nr:MAG: PEP-CTERM sorting domain-containing protein [bacterium]